ncbi:MAG: hypothetical protein HXS48_24670 [Theionarchaea archaeon]|nr:hypothetical protein [Theionarchaea archaeon]
MKKGKFLEVLRITVMLIVLEEHNSTSPTELSSLLGRKRELVIEYA